MGGVPALAAVAAAAAAAVASPSLHKVAQNTATHKDAVVLLDQAAALRRGAATVAQIRILNFFSSGLWHVSMAPCCHEHPDPHRPCAVAVVVAHATAHLVQ